MPSLDTNGSKLAVILREFSGSSPSFEELLLTFLQFTGSIDTRLCHPRMYVGPYRSTTTSGHKHSDLAWEGACTAECGDDELCIKEHCHFPDHNAAMNNAWKSAWKSTKSVEECGC